MSVSAWGGYAVFLYNWQSLIAGVLGLLAGLAAFGGVLIAARLQVRAMHRAAEAQVRAARQASDDQVAAVQKQLADTQAAREESDRRRRSVMERAASTPQQVDHEPTTKNAGWRGERWLKTDATRTEVLMVLATGLAAIAALGSSVAAFRQEKAIFTNNLYSKQVDTISSILMELTRIGVKLDALSNRFDARSMNLSSPEIKELTELNGDKKYSQLLLSGPLGLLMPTEVMSEVGNAYEDLLDVITLIPKAFGPNLTVEGNLNYKQKIEVYFCDIDRIRFCASQQLERGTTLRGNVFSACSSKYKPTHKSDCL
jgi:hypothetical protein